MHVSRTAGAVNTMCSVWKFSCMNFSHSVMPIIMYINDARIFIFTHQ